MQQNNIYDTLKSEGLLLAVIPFIGTLIGFIYEAGYLSFYDVPISVVRMDFGRIITSTMLVFLFLMLWFIGLHFSLSLPTSTNVIKRALFKPILRLLIFVPFFYLIPDIPYGGLILGGGFILLVLVRLIPPVFHRKTGTSYTERLSLYIVETEATEHKIDIKISDIFFLILIASALVFGIGRNAGIKKEYYWVPEKFPNMLVVGFYGDTAVLKEFDDSFKVIKKKMILIDNKSEEGYAYLKVKTGMLVSKKN